MEITKRQKRLLYILAIIVLYALYDLSISSDKSVIATNGVLSVNTASLIRNSTTIAKTTSALQLNIDTNWSRDPFKRNDMRVQKKVKIKYRPKFKVNAITLSNGTFSAMINQKYVSPSDHIKGYKVLKIFKGKVKMQGPDGIFYLKLK